MQPKKQLSRSKWEMEAKTSNTNGIQGQNSVPNSEGYFAEAESLEETKNVHLYRFWTVEQKKVLRKADSLSMMG
ncbi:unnamed protein product [Prunus armeniaca]|uniref:Uncharacterized protein n=1 Tax=Prunus armeniaca TaxID=36596 RepID=A0A6J5X971_PRUAR|nr:unnamed protein product [Prunus armeniaca]CAB4278663.1 unnamed protein product [Prunus armeniaca]CAB4309087.1 unnamed protein product [Prunus armeniaca]